MAVKRMSVVIAPLLAATIGVAASAEGTDGLPWMFSGDTSRLEVSSGESQMASIMTLSAHSVAFSDSVRDGLQEFIFRSWDADESVPTSVKRYPFKALTVIVR